MNDGKISQRLEKNNSQMFEYKKSIEWNKNIKRTQIMIDASSCVKQNQNFNNYPLNFHSGCSSYTALFTKIYYQIGDALIKN